MKIEHLAANIRSHFGLSGLHIFDADGGWTVFGFRRHAEGFQALVESGSGETIELALLDLNKRLDEGPIHKKSMA